MSKRSEFTSFALWLSITMIICIALAYMLPAQAQAQAQAQACATSNVLSAHTDRAVNH